MNRERLEAKLAKVTKLKESLEHKLTAMNPAWIKEYKVGKKLLVIFQLTYYYKYSIRVGMYVGPVKIRLFGVGIALLYTPDNK